MLWKRIRSFVLLAFLLACCACTDLASPVECPDGLVCPPGTTCAANQKICIPGLCGNGVIDTAAGEACDDGNIIPQDGCSADCTSMGRCGDGFVNELDGEECDDGIISKDCDVDCTFRECGDEVINPVAGELCDDGGDSLDCDADCTLRACGDRSVNPAAGEECDQGDSLTAACDTDCTFAKCGDGMLNPLANEQCDDGNLVNADECNALCELSDCDSQIQDGDETDVDCGGRCGPSCEPREMCSSNDDYAGFSVCLGGACVPEWRRLVAGVAHTCVLLDTGKVRCWGFGNNGELGYGNT